MKADINLLSAVPEESEKDKTVRVLKILAFSSIFVTVFSSIIIFLLTEFFSPKRIAERENKVFQGLSVLHPKKAKLAIINDRVTLINKILDTRSKYDYELGTILKMIPADTTIDTLEIGKSQISVGLNSKSLLNLDLFLDSLIEMVKNKQIIKGVTIDSMGLDARTGIYRLLVRMDKI